MSSTELFFRFLKKMQETAKKIEPAPKDPERIRALRERRNSVSSKREDNCLF